MKKYIIQLSDGSYLKHRCALPIHSYPKIDKYWMENNTTNDLSNARIFNNKSAVSNAMIGGKELKPKAVEVEVTISVVVPPHAELFFD